MVSDNKGIDIYMVRNYLKGSQRDHLLYGKGYYKGISKSVLKDSIKGSVYLW